MAGLGFLLLVAAYLLRGSRVTVGEAAERLRAALAIRPESEPARKLLIDAEARIAAGAAS